MIYKYCGFTISTERLFPSFHSCYNDKIDLIITSTNNDFKYSKSGDIFFQDDNNYVLNFGEKGYYKITKNQIMCCFDDDNFINATICNIPMSIVSILNNKIPCHCSSVILKNQVGVILFLAEKGTGKSTLAFLANKLLDYKIFGDDMVTIEQKNGIFYANQGSSNIKVCKDLIDCFDIKSSNEEVYQGLNKFYYSPKNNYLSDEIVQLNNIFIIERSEKFKIEKLPPMFCRTFLARNIVGIDVIQKLLIKEINASLNKLTNISLFKLFVPDSIDDLSANLQTIFEEIEKVF